MVFLGKSSTNDSFFHIYASLPQGILHYTTLYT